MQGSKGLKKYCVFPGTAKIGQRGANMEVCATLRATGQTRRAIDAPAKWELSVPSSGYNVQSLVYNVQGSVYSG